MKHRNSQKRIYIENGVYFITTNTKERYPYFENDIFCEIFIKQIEFCKGKYDLDLYAYKINPNHLHLLFSVGSKFTHSDIMFSLKKQAAHGINQILGFVDIPENKNNSEMHKYISDKKDEFQNQYGVKHNVPKFHWQKSFHDHYIRDEVDLFFHVEYIRNQHVKHELFQNKWLYIGERFN
jgi:REP element-mobilizing transposase RayT